MVYLKDRDMSCMLRNKPPKKKHNMSPNSLANLTPGLPGGPGNTTSRRGKPNTPRGKALTSIKNYKYGFYSDKFKPCIKCEDRGRCPYNEELEGKEELYAPMFDEFEIQRCTKEILTYVSILEDLDEDFDFLKADEHNVKNYAFLKVRLGRALRYMADKGVTQIRKMKDEKGQIHEVEMQNILQKGFYFDIKAVKDSAQALKISREAREPQEHKHDLALIFTQGVQVDQTTKKAITAAGDQMIEEKRTIKIDPKILYTPTEKKNKKKINTKGLSEFAKNNMG